MQAAEKKDEVIGFVGLGVMGTPMAEHLLKAGYPVWSVHFNPTVPQNLLDAGIKMVDTLAELAAKSDVIILMLPASPDVQKVADGLEPHLKPGTLVIDMSSIAPETSRKVAQDFWTKKQCQVLDAPVSGGQIGAQQASMSIMVGGEESAFARALPIFQKLGKNITHVGGTGAGQISKAANQILVGAGIAALAEAFVLAQKAGVDPAQVVKALTGGLAHSRILEVIGPRMIERKFEPGFRIALHKKDIGIAMDEADSKGISLPLASTIQGLFDAAKEADAEQLDHSALLLILEKVSQKSLSAAAQ